MAEVVLRLAVMDNGTIKVEKGDKKAPKKMTKAEFKKSLQGKTMLNVDNITVLQSNPCTWVLIGGQYFWICW